MSTSSWTNPTIRKRLGEAGFLEVRDERKVVAEEGHLITKSIWKRGGAKLYLSEFTFKAPLLQDGVGDNIDPNALGVRNVNTQAGNDR